MKRKLIAAAAMLAVSTASYAWWGPFGDDGWGHNGYGDGAVDGGFSMGFSGHGHGDGWGNGYHGWSPYGYSPYGYGYAPYGNGYAPYGYAPTAYYPPMGMTTPDQIQKQMEAQRNASLNFQKAMEQQQRQAMEAQREAFERQVAMMRGNAPAAGSNTQTNGSK